MPTSARKPKPTASAAQASASEIEALRACYHSVHDTERSDVIEMLGSMKDPDATRELISLYGECEWRATRLQVIRALSNHPAQRGLEFLFKLAQEPKDIPIAEAAIWSLGQTHHPLAARFLVRQYRACAEFLKPAVVGALGQVPDRTLAREFLEALPTALRSRQTALVKNLVLTLGELKVREALPTLEAIALDRSQGPVSLAALVAIGKISRDPRAIDAMERRFRDDLFEYQLYTSVKTQVQFRAQWKLEDYLSRIFGSPSFHPALPFELSHFAAEDVREGLRLFSGPEHFGHLCTALARVDFEGVASWYAELIDFDKLDEIALARMLWSMGSRFDAGLRGPLEAVGALKTVRSSPKLTHRWLEAVALALPDADAELKAFFASETFRSMPAADRVSSLNHLIDFGLGAQLAGEKLQGVVRILESVLESDGAPEARARALRGLGHLGMPSKKATAFAREHAGEEAYSPSCLKYLELCPDKGAAGVLLGLSEAWSKAAPAQAVSLLRALSAQHELPQEHAGVERLLRAATQGDAELELRLEGIRFLGTHPRKPFGPALAASLAGGSPKGPDAERVTLAAVIALRSSPDAADDAVIDSLSRLLRSAHQSIAGRALDTLTVLPATRAKRVVVDFLRERADDVEICGKIIRSLQAPESGADYFVSVIDGILKASPQHAQLDGLLHLRERIAASGRASRPGGMAAKGPDIAAIDAALAGKIASYETLDDQAKTALRSAEVPFLHPKTFDEYVDKSSSLVEYCKAVDIQLEKTLGRKHLFSKLENQLHEFQSALHAAGLGEDFPNAERVIERTGLGRHFNAQSLPLHKMLTLAQSIRNGRIVNERFKTLDGLRAWAVVLLLFGRKAGAAKPLIPLKGLTDDQVAHLCKRLIALQEVRNPAAHRQTVVVFKSIDETRGEALALLNLIQKAL